MNNIKIIFLDFFFTYSGNPKNLPYHSYWGGGVAICSTFISSGEPSKKKLHSYQDIAAMSNSGCKGNMYDIDFIDTLRINLKNFFFVCYECKFIFERLF